jgi:hypothetical protein
MNFFEKLLPKEGYYCVAELMENGGFKHRFFDKLDDVVQNITALDAQGKTIYLAQAGFKTSDNRKQENVQNVKAFWLDIDCGEKKFAQSPAHSYPSQQAAAVDLQRFCEESGFPLPCLLNSGNGLYAYWFIQEEMPEPTWKGYASLLKKTLEAYEFKADPAVTANSASVLRPPGTTNRKDPSNEKPVLVLNDAEPISLDAFKRILETAAKAKKVTTDVLKPPKKPGLNALFAANHEYPTSSALLIAEECAQVRALRDTKGAVSEPIWYALAGLLNFTVEASEIMHAWSDGNHAELLNKKIEQAKRNQTGPTTCHKIGEVNPQGCVGCSHCNKIVSPIQLGVPKPEAALERVVDSETGEERIVEKEAPFGFTRSANGIWFEGGDEPVCVYNYDLWIESFQHDESLSADTLTLKHAHPIDGIKEFNFSAATLDDLKTFSQTMHNNGVYISGSDNKKAMVNYVEGYIEALKRKFGTQTLFCQMGWKGTDNFVLGDHIFKPNVVPEQIGFARNVPELVKSFREEGSIEDWAGTTKALSSSEMIPYAFVLLAGGFGAPLLKFTGYAGAVLSMVGETGIGKTVMLRWINSIFGDPEKLMGLRDDTTNTIISRLGVFGSIPYTMDEVSNIDPMDLSNFIYRVTQGRDKGRLGQDARERKVLNSWNTLATVTSNHSLVEKLGTAKADAGAEINRIFEIFLQKTDVMSRETATNIWRTLGDNYGGVAKIYVQYLLDHAEDHRGKLDTITAEIDRRTHAAADERFWSAIAGCAIYAGLIAQSLGLIKFSIAPVLDWVCEYIPLMREGKSENISTPMNTLATFLDYNSSKILVVRKDKNRNEVLPMMEMRGDIVGRFELDAMKLYISKDELKRYCSKNYVSLKQTAEALMRGPKPALLSRDCSKVLGSGINRASISQKCWCVDMSCPDLGYVAMSLVRKTMAEEKEAINQ